MADVNLARAHDPAKALRRWLGRTAALLAVAAGAPASASHPDLIVAADGSGDYTTIQAAIDAVPAGNPQRLVIRIRDGVYFEAVRIPATRPHLRLRGDSRDGTVVNWDRSYFDPKGRWVADPVVRNEADDVRLESLTIHNLAREPGGTGGKWDAAFMNYGDRVVLRNVHLRADHDTLLIYGPGKRVHVADSWIQGRGDFIASFTTAYLLRTVLETIRDPGHFLFQEGHPGWSFAEQQKLVVEDSRFTGLSTHLFRPTGVSNLSSDAVVYLIHNVMEHDIGVNRPVVGFHTEAETAGAWIFHHGNHSTTGELRWADYSVLGVASPHLTIAPVHANDAGQPFVQELSPEEAADITPQAILGGGDGWDPEAPESPPTRWIAVDGFWDEAHNWVPLVAPDVDASVRIATGRARVRSGGMQVDTLSVDRFGAEHGVLVLEGGDVTVAHDVTVAGGSIAGSAGALVTRRDLVVLGGETQLGPGVDLSADGRVRLGEDVSLAGGSLHAGTDLVATGTTTVHGSMLSAVEDAVVAEGSLALDGGASLSAELILGGTGALLSIANANVMAARLVVSPSAQLELSAGAAVRAGGYSNKGTTRHAAGALEAETFDIHAGSYELQGGSATVSGPANIGTVPEAVGLVSVRGGVAHFAAGITVGRSAGSRGVLSIEGGRVELGGPLILGVAGGEGELRITGGELRAPSLVNGGSDTGIGRVVIGGNGGYARVVGDYTQGALATLVVDTDASGPAPLDIDGDVSFAAGSVLDLAGTAAPGEYEILRWTGTAVGAPVFAPGVDEREWSFSIAPGRLLVARHPPRVPALPPVGLGALGLLLVWSTRCAARSPRASAGACPDGSARRSTAT